MRRLNNYLDSQDCKLGKQVHLDKQYMNYL